MAIQLNHETPADAELIGSRIGRIDPDIFENQSEEATDDESVNEVGDPTEMPDHGEYDHQQDDDYALGGHVTRSGSV